MSTGKDGIVKEITNKLICNGAWQKVSLTQTSNMKHRRTKRKCKGYQNRMNTDETHQA